MKFVFALLLSLSASLTDAAFAAGPSTCVLVFERPESAIAQFVTRTFQGVVPAENIRVAARPVDFLDCLRGGFEKIVIVAHALESTRRDGTWSLGYLDLLEGSERQSFLQQALSAEDAKLRKLQADLAEITWQPFDLDDRTAEDKRNLELQLYYAKKNIKAIQGLLESSKAVYEPKSFLPKIFQRARDILANQRAQGSIRLKEIRWVSCEPYSVFASYPDLEKLISENRLHIDVAPKARLLSWISGRWETVPDKDWLLKK